MAQLIILLSLKPWLSMKTRFTKSGRFSKSVILSQSVMANYKRLHLLIILKYILMSKLLLLFLGLLFQTTLSAQISGFVFEDINQNQQKDKNEKGIDKVSVTNQIRVVLTDENGYFKFDSLAHLGTLAISLPIGYKGKSWHAISKDSEQVYNFPFRKNNCQK